MQPRRSLRLACRQNKELPDTRNSQTNRPKNETAQSTQKTKKRLGELETTQNPLEDEGTFYRQAGSRLLNPSSAALLPKIWGRFPEYHFNEPDDFGDPPGAFDAFKDSEADMEGTVRHGTYRLKNLARNKIHFRHPSDRLPDAVAACFRSILETAPDMPHIDRNAMTLAVHELDQLGLRCTEVQLTLFFLKYVFPQEGATGLEQVMATLMYRHVVPGHTTATSAVTQLSQPKPDLVYGYSERTLQQYSVFDMLLEGPITFGEASPDLLFPFFCIEFKATATGGNLWVAANQCAGASATCVGIIDQLNTVLGEAGCSHTVLNLCYSLAVDNNLGQLYVSWKDGGDQVTYIQRVESFLFANPEDFTRLCRRVRAILEWGRGSRLSSICQALDSILKGRHRMASK